MPTTGGPNKGAVKHVTFFAVCTDLATGKVVHDVKLGEEDDPAFCHDFPTATPRRCSSDECTI